MDPRDPIALLFRDPRATDLCLNGVDSAWIDRGAEGLTRLPRGTPGLFGSAEEQRSWVEGLLGQAGVPWSSRSPFAELVLPRGDGACVRVHVTLPPVGPEGALVCLRRLGIGRDAETAGEEEGEAARTPAERLQLRWGNDARLLRLAGAVHRRESILIVGATGAGKTTLLSDLLALCPPHERLILLEDVPEIPTRHPHALRLTARPANADGFGEIGLRELLRQALRMRPDRIILGECRGREIADLLQALNTGHGGTLATLHANSCREALDRLELLALLGFGGDLPVAVARGWIASSLRWIAHVRRTARGREVAELQRVAGREGDTILLEPVLPTDSV